MSIRSKIVLAGIALSLWSGATLATLKNVENAYESDPAHVTLPGGPTGQVVIRECDGCRPVALRVDARTRYIVGRASSQPVTLAALRSAAASREAAGRLLTVFYDIETNVVTRIVLSAG
jgi:hypothetical protein